MSDLDPTLPTYLAIARVIEQAIKSGELSSGDRVPSVTTIVQTYGCSKNTALRVIKWLQENGLVTVRPGWGSFVV